MLRCFRHSFFCNLIGVGATTVNPYLAIDSIYQRYEKKLFGKSDYESCVIKFKKSIDAGLLKIMSRWEYLSSVPIEAVATSKRWVKQSNSFRLFSWNVVKNFWNRYIGIEKIKRTTLEV